MGLTGLPVILSLRIPPETPSIFPAARPFHYADADTLRTSHSATVLTIESAFSPSSKRENLRRPFPNRSGSVPEAGVSRDDDNPGFGHRESPPILFEVVADFDVGRNVDVFVDDNASKFRMPSNVDAVHQDALFHIGVAVDAHFRR